MNVAKRAFVPEPLLISIPQAAQRLGSTVSTVRNLIWGGELPFCRVGKRHMIPVGEISRWVERNTERNPC